MMSKISGFGSVAARVEMLESRCLMSATGMSHVAALVETPAAVRAKVHAPIPDITGAPYAGTVIVAGQSLEVTITFNTESTKGAVQATVIGGTVFSCKGTVKNTRAVSIKGKAGKLSATFKGTVSTDLNTFTGKYTLKGNKSFNGPFTLSRSA